MKVISQEWPVKPFSVNLPTTDDLELIDIDSLFDEDTDDRPVL